MKLFFKLVRFQKFLLNHTRIIRNISIFTRKVEVEFMICTNLVDIIRNSCIDFFSVNWRLGRSKYICISNPIISLFAFYSKDIITYFGFNFLSLNLKVEIKNEKIYN